MRSSVVADAIVISPRADVQRLITEQLKLKSVSNVISLAPGPDGSVTDEMIDALDRFTKALLVIDWALGDKEVVRILGHNRRKFPGQIRPSLLIAEDVSEQVIATAAEYSITQIYTEEITPKNLGGRLGTLIISETIPSEVKKGLNEAAELRHSNDAKGAFAVLQKLLQKHPTNLRIKCEVAETLMQLDQWENAAKLLEGVDQNKPPYLRGIHLRGRCLMKLGRFEEARAALESASLFNPHDVERLADIGQCLLQLDRNEQAEATFDRALEVDPTYRPAKLGKGQSQLLDGQVNDALALLRDVASEIEMASLFNTSAVLSMRHGRHEAGMSLYQSALKALGRDPKIQARLYFNMGIGFRRWGKPEQALGCFDQSIKLDPGYSKAREQQTLLNKAIAGKSAAEKQPHAKVLPKVSGEGSAFGDPGGLSMPDLFTGDLSKVLDEDDLEESLYD